MGPLPTHPKSTKLISMRKLTATLCLTFSVLLGSAVGSETSSEIIYLTGEQIRLLVSENKMEFEDIYPVEVNFRESGDFIAFYGGGLYSAYGKWSLSKNQICIQFDDQGTVFDKRENCFFLTISGKTVEAFNKVRGSKETWEFYEIPDAFSQSLAKPSSKNKVATEKKREDVEREVAEEEKKKTFKQRTAKKITIPLNLRGEVKVATGFEYEKPVIIKGNEPDSSLTIQLSKDGKKFRAAIKIETAKSECSGEIGNGGLISSDECVFQSAQLLETYISGLFPNFLLNEEKTCLLTDEAHFSFSSCEFSKSVSFKYPNLIETKVIANSEKKKRQELTKKVASVERLQKRIRELEKQAAEEKKRRELAKKAAEEKKRRELAKKAAEEKKRRELAKKAAEEKKRQELAKKAAEEKKREELAKKAAEEKKRQELAKKAAEEKKRRELAKKAAEEKKRRELAKKAAEEKKRRELAKKAAEEKKRRGASEESS